MTAAAPLRLSPPTRSAASAPPPADLRRPRPAPPRRRRSRLLLYAVADLARHATVTQGRLPRPAPVGSSAREAAVTVATARALHLHPGADSASAG
ncbi:hypothetical protein O1L44_22635 [Streptomyces noursei]|nr:hypothetical protein [Streptomyces noursei]